MTIYVKQILTLTFILLIWTPAQAIEFKWLDDQGAMHTLSELKGKPTVLHLWASWCPPCQSELPDFAAWRNEHLDIQVIPVSLDSSIGDAAAFITAKHLTMPALLSDSMQAGKLGVRGLPTTLIITADGRIVQQYLGPRNWHNTAFNEQLAKVLHP